MVKPSSLQAINRVNGEVYPFKDKEEEWSYETTTQQQSKLLSTRKNLVETHSMTKWIQEDIQKLSNYGEMLRLAPLI